MRRILKVSLLAMVLILGVSSCTAESLDEENTVTETVATDPDKKDPKPPTDPNGD